LSGESSAPVDDSLTCRQWKHFNPTKDRK